MTAGLTGYFHTSGKVQQLSAYITELCVNSWPVGAVHVACVVTKS